MLALDTGDVASGNCWRDPAGPPLPGCGDFGGSPDVYGANGSFGPPQRQICSPPDIAEAVLTGDGW
jgi:hypothetical protein